MNISSIIALGQAIDDIGSPLLLVLLLIGIIFYARYRMKRDKDEALERKDDRLVLTNHLSLMIEDDTKSRIELTRVLTQLCDRQDNREATCRQIVKDIREELERPHH